MEIWIKLIIAIATGVSAIIIFLLQAAFYLTGIMAFTKYIGG